MASLLLASCGSDSPTDTPERHKNHVGDTVVLSSDVDKGDTQSIEHRTRARVTLVKVIDMDTGNYSATTDAPIDKGFHPFGIQLSIDNIGSNDLSYINNKLAGGYDVDLFTGGYDGNKIEKDKISKCKLLGKNLPSVSTGNSVAEEILFEVPDGKSPSSFMFTLYGFLGNGRAWYISAPA